MAANQDSVVHLTQEQRSKRGRLLGLLQSLGSKYSKEGATCFGEPLSRDAAHLLVLKLDKAFAFVYGRPETYTMKLVACFDKHPMYSRPCKTLTEKGVITLDDFFSRKLEDLKVVCEEAGVPFPPLMEEMHHTYHHPIQSAMIMAENSVFGLGDLCREQG